ncbi:uncharacterized protein LOC135497944 [Lineus longissimus]|uniref:uncharacterized protein LOC135497944 n=1 Tax=Lineus longissimus TaxID=88925 RepID=UPI002B4CE021
MFKIVQVLHSGIRFTFVLATANAFTLISFKIVLRDHVILQPELGVVRLKSFLECGIYCSKTSGCSTFSYQFQNGGCRLSMADWRCEKATVAKGSHVSGKQEKYELNHEMEIVSYRGNMKALLYHSKLDLVIILTTNRRGENVFIYKSQGKQYRLKRKYFLKDLGELSGEYYDNFVGVTIDRRKMRSIYVFDIKRGTKIATFLVPSIYSIRKNFHTPCKKTSITGIRVLDSTVILEAVCAVLPREVKGKRVWRVYSSHYLCATSRSSRRIKLNMLEKIDGLSIRMAGVPERAFDDFKLELTSCGDRCVDVAGIKTHGIHVYVYDVVIEYGEIEKKKKENIIMIPKVDNNNIVIFSKSKMAVGQIFSDSYRLVKILPPCFRRTSKRNVSTLAKTSRSYYWFLNKKDDVVAWPRYWTPRPTAQVHRPFAECGSLF